MNIALNLLLINLIGIIGAAIATLASYVIVFIFRINDTKKYLYMKVYWAKIAVNLVLIAGMSASVMFLEYGLLQNLINCVIFIIIVALNFTTCISAIKLILNKKGGRKAPQEGK